MRILRYFIVIFILICGVSFAILNPGGITLNYWLATKTWPISLFTVVIFCSGMGVGLFFSMLFFFRYKVEIASLRYKLKLARKEVLDLRIIPAKSSF